MLEPTSKLARPAVTVAIPAQNERYRIAACLAALVLQRDVKGAPIPQGTFGILLFCNSCTGDTAQIAKDFAVESLHSILVVEEELPDGARHAGGARARATKLAAQRLICAGHQNGRS